MANKAWFIRVNKKKNSTIHPSIKNDTYHTRNSNPAVDDLVGMYVDEYHPRILAAGDVIL